MNSPLLGHVGGHEGHAKCEVIAPAVVFDRRFVLDLDTICLRQSVLQLRSTLIGLTGTRCTVRQDVSALYLFLNIYTVRAVS